MSDVNPAAPPDALTQAAERVACALDADVLGLVGYIDPDAHRRLADACLDRRCSRTNAHLVLETPGGYPHAAYAVARHLQGRYARLTVQVPRRCAGAGVLLVLAAHTLVLCEHATLGPLAAPAPEGAALDALSDLTRREVDALGPRARALRESCGPDLSMETATEVVARLAACVLAPLSGQLDLRALGEAAAERTAVERYGQRLLERGARVDLEALERLLSAYPSPHFPIDRAEATGLLGDVRAPTPGERLLAEALGGGARWPADGCPCADRALAFLSTEPPPGAGGDDGAA